MSSDRGSLIVGAGLMGTWHARSLKRLGVPVMGIVDPDLDRARALARVNSQCLTYRSVEEAVADSVNGTAHVCTPLPSHYSTVKALLLAGFHTLVEKPLASSFRETEEIVRMANDQDLRVCPVHQFGFQRGFLLAERALGEAGKILHIDATIFSAGGDGRSQETREKILWDILPHPLSLMARLVGEGFPKTRWHVEQTRQDELRAAASCEGTSLGILISMKARPTRNTLRISCEKATFHVDLFHGHLVREGGKVSRGRKISRPFTVSAASFVAAGSNLLRRTVAREAAYPGLRELIRRFYLSTCKEGPPPITPNEILDIARMCEEMAFANHLEPK